MKKQGIHPIYFSLTVLLCYLSPLRHSEAERPKNLVRLAAPTETMKAETLLPAYNAEVHLTGAFGYQSLFEQMEGGVLGALALRSTKNWIRPLVESGVVISQSPWTGNFFSVPEGDIELTLFKVPFRARLDANILPRLTVYPTVGIDILLFSVDRNPPIQMDPILAKLAAVFGGGLQYHLTPQWRFRVDTNYSVGDGPLSFLSLTTGIVTVLK